MKSTIVIALVVGPYVCAFRPSLTPSKLTVSRCMQTREQRFLSPNSRSSRQNYFLLQSLDGSVDVQEPNAAAPEKKVNKGEIVDVDEQQNRRFLTESYVLAQAAAIGVSSGLVVALFKLSVEFVRNFMYGAPLLTGQPLIVLALIPAIGGLAVGLLTLAGDFSPGLKGSVKEVDDEADEVMRRKSINKPSFRPLRFLRKSAAAVCTLGSGCSLGPEGPSVELGLNLSRIWMNLFPLGRNNEDRLKMIQRNRLLLSCGAAAGVSAGFNAPLAGVFFALEIVQGAISSSHHENGHTHKVTDNLTAGSTTITAILLASVLSALVCKAFLGEHLVLKLAEYSLKTPLIELPLYLLLGAMAGVVAFGFSQTAKLSQSFFDGKLGPPLMRNAVGPLPKWIKPILGGLFCGLVGLQFPQILFFGYETLNSLLANSSLPTSLMMSLLLVKVITTAVSAGSGLVGGTFAPSLFLGAMLGGSFHNLAQTIFNVNTAGAALQLADVPAYAMVGAACVLAALFRAPLTASLVLFELTRDYDVILPLMASAGVACVVGDVIDAKFEQIQNQMRPRRDQDAVSWGDLADKETEE